ncbi:MAG TPA: hypothetical protein VGT03_05110 [Candidatus Acidoferrales bacterium]|nr:hypothetical protein [Candidatus Acidoferrales bacterium]
MSFAAMLLFAAAIVPAQSVRGGRIILPIELVAGEPATLGVLMPNGRVQADARVVLSNGEVLTTDESGRAHFLAPAQPGILFAQIADTEIRSACEVQRREGAESLRIQAAPRLTPLDGQIRIRGSGFEGDADRNEVRLREKRPLVLAASPRELVILPPPESEPGMAALELKVGDQSASAQVTLIRVEATPPTVPPGKRKKITIRAFGTEARVNLELQNQQPEIVKFANEGDIRLRTRGGRDNSAKVQIKGLRAGEFSFAVRLLPDLEVAGIPAAHDFLEAAQKIAPPAEKSLFEDILRRLKQKKPDSSAVRGELRRLTPNGPSGDYGALIRAAREALFGAE